MLVAGSELGYVLKIEPKAKLLTSAPSRIEAVGVTKSHPLRERRKPHRESGTLELLLKTSDGQERKSEISAVVEHSTGCRREQEHRVLCQTGKCAFAREALCSGHHIHGGRDDVRFAITGVEILDVPEGVFTATVDTVKEGFAAKSP